MNIPNLYKSGPLENKSNSSSPITNNMYAEIMTYITIQQTIYTVQLSMLQYSMRTAFCDNESDSPRMTTRTDITKQNASLIASAIKFTDAGRKSYLFSVIKKKTAFKIPYTAK